VTDDRQTDRAKEKSVGIGGIVGITRRDSVFGIGVFLYGHVIQRVPRQFLTTDTSRDFMCIMLSCFNVFNLLSCLWL